jgi:hypothetical protein
MRAIKSAEEIQEQRNECLALISQYGIAQINNAQIDYCCAQLVMGWHLSLAHWVGSDEKRNLLNWEPSVSEEDSIDCAREVALEGDYPTPRARTEAALEKSLKSEHNPRTKPE